MSQSDKDMQVRVGANANLDLTNFMQTHPYVLKGPGRVDWIVGRSDDDRWVASGVIRVPVEMYFKDAEDEDSAALELDRIVIDGKRQYDSRTDEDLMAAEEDPGQRTVHGINVDGVNAETFVRLKKNLK